MLKIFERIKNFFNKESNTTKLLSDGKKLFTFNRIDNFEYDEVDRDRLKKLYVGICKNEVDLTSQSLQDLNRILALVKLDELKNKKINY